MKKIILKKQLIFLFFLSAFALLSAQKDSIYIEAKLSQDKRILEVNQEITFYNTTSTPLSEIQLLNWIAAYKKNETPLHKRKIEDRNSELHFAKLDELGKLNQLSVQINGLQIGQNLNLESENLRITLPNSLESGEKTKIQLQYQLLLPLDKFTGYGTSENNVSLKYFFIVPDSFSSKNSGEKKYIDVEESSNHSTFWTINLDIPVNCFSKSNLPELQPNYFKGFLKTDPEIIISTQNYPSITTKIDEKLVEITFGYHLNDEEMQNLEFYLPLHLKFIKEKIGLVPNKIFISEKFKKKEDFFGNDDIKFWKFTWELFSIAENTDLDYFSIISKNILEQNIITYKQEDHWFKNGLKTYLEIQYLKKFYKDAKLLGNLPEASIFGVKPLKLFHASRLQLTERYGIAYHYMMMQNLDQKIAEPFSQLSNFNEMAISNFETGSVLDFVAEKMETEKFNYFLKNYLIENFEKPIDTKDFLDKLAVASNNSSSFIQNLAQRKHRMNFDVKKFRKNNNNLEVKIQKTENNAVPFKLEATSKTGKTQTYWFETSEKKSEQYYEIPETDIHKIMVNGDYFFPENNFRDNYIYTKGFFANTKKIKLKLINDIPNPEYNEIYINPRLNFNAYDKVLLGLNFRNEGLFDHKFTYSLTPYFSTGTGKFTGSGSVSYSILPPDSFFRNLTFGVSGSYFHYDYDLSYRKFSAFSTMNFTKNPRSTIGQSVGISYNHYQKDINPELNFKNEYQKYNLWSVGYAFSDNKLIHEKYFSANFQGMEDFQKISAEAFYRYEFAKNKKISLRLFAGYFLQNNTRNDFFDYGISKISNYSFSYGLLGQSATSGIFAQQFVLADGGFKSLIDTSANQWITSVNADTHVWKMFNIYADAGMYKNKGLDPKFIWDSGIKARIIPDFLEIYLPVYSTLGFEPASKNYFQKIRFTLVLNLSAVINTARRGWY